MRKPALPFVAFFILSSCATGTSTGTSLNADRISREEIEQAGPSNAYDLIRKLRPVWLRWRGSTSFTQETDVKVYLDGTPMGEREALRTIDTADIESIEYLDARRATNRYGAGHVQGAILIRTRG